MKARLYSMLATLLLTLVLPAWLGATELPLERGRYLARMGNCMGCHTTRGGPEYAGGRVIDTPFGAVYSPNITSDRDTGIGAWSADDFWRALHEGRSRDGRLLAPAFPYPNYTRVARADADALFAYLRTVAPVAQASRPHALQFPFGTQAAMWAWRTLFFRPGVYEPQSERSVEWNRGAYLVQGLGHCGACHTPRNALGAARNSQWLAGGMIPVQNWYAPALHSEREAGVASWPVEEVAELLQTGVAPRGSVLGPMAEVVAGSTQYLSDSDARAMAIYLRSLPPRIEQALAPATKLDENVRARGGKLFETHCASCHGKSGEGERGAFPALAGNRAVLMDNPTNLVRALLQGGYPPSTAGHPRPHGMPPFQQLLSDTDMAALASYIRNAWGNAAAPVATIEVHRVRERRSP